MDEIDEWTVGPIPIRPRPDRPRQGRLPMMRAAPFRRRNPGSRTHPRTVPPLRTSLRSKDPAQGAVACPYARDSGHASVAVEGAVPGQHAVRSSRARADRPEPSSLVAASRKRARRTRGRRRHPSRDPRHPPCRRHRLLFGRGSHARLGHRRRCVVAAAASPGSQPRNSPATDANRPWAGSRPPDANWTRPWKRRNGRRRRIRRP